MTEPESHVRRDHRLRRPLIEADLGAPRLKALHQGTEHRTGSEADLGANDEGCLSGPLVDVWRDRCRADEHTKYGLGNLAVPSEPRKGLPHMVRQRLTW